MDNNTTYEEFEELCKEAIREKCCDEYHRTESVNIDSYLTAKWNNGGRGGASCYDDGDREYYSIDPEPEPQDEYLDLFLQKTIPNLTFLQFRELSRSDMYSYEDDAYYDYYGNISYYRERTLNIRTLYDTLMKILSR